jgi:hypothetical protein
VALTLDATSTGCSLSGSTSGSTVSFPAAGTCKIDANQAGNANYLPAGQLQQSFSVAAASQTITFTSTPASPMFGGGAYTVTATGGASGNPVTFTSATTSVCTVSGSTVTYVAAGTCTVNANQAGNGNYNAALPAPQTFTVAKANQTITFTSTAPAAAKVGGSTYTVTATGGASGNAVTFTSATTSVCTVVTATVTFVGAGTCTINANQAFSGNYNAAPQVQQTFSVAASAVTGIVWTNIVGGTTSCTGAGTNNYSCTISGTGNNAAAAANVTFVNASGVATVFSTTADQTISVVAGGKNPATTSLTISQNTATSTATASVQKNGSNGAAMTATFTIGATTYTATLTIS